MEKGMRKQALFRPALYNGFAPITAPVFLFTGRDAAITSSQ